MLNLGPPGPWNMSLQISRNSRMVKRKGKLTDQAVWPV